MSQPRDSNEQSDALLEPIKDIGELEDIFTTFEKPKSNFRIGVEHERFVIDPATLSPAKWHGANGMHALMKELQANLPNASKVVEDDQLIAIMLDNASVTLEPGCQLELSGAPLSTIFEIDEELKRYETTLEQALEKLNLSSLLMGFHPNAKQADFDWVPKQRYKIMRAYMEKTGSRGHDMMLRTCTVQGNFDYSSEQDMIASFRLALLVSPIVTALFASSPFKEGKPSGFLSERTMVWHDTDNDRCGFPLEVFESDFSYRRWIARVIDTPMYFVRRDGVYHNATTITFREFMKDGFSGFKAAQRDFADHLTTIFTDTRIKPQLEVRSADCGPKPFLRALPAFWKGLLYDDTSRDAALKLLSGVDPTQLVQYQIDSAKFGLSAKYERKELGVVASDLVELSKEGLRRQAKDNALAKDESIFLEPLDDVIRQGKSTAQIMLELYAKSGGSSLMPPISIAQFPTAHAESPT